MDTKSRPRVVVVGAGFGGLTAAQRLADLPVQITVVDRKNHHTFQPLLYQVATAGLSPGEIASPIRAVFRGDKNVISLLEEVQDFELAERQAVSGGVHEPLNFVVVGAGPTGVELAGTLAEITHHVLAHEFHSIDPRSAAIWLLEGGPRVLPAYPDDLSHSAEEQLRRLGVEV